MSKCFSGSQSYIVLVGDCLWLEWFEQLVNSRSDSSFSPPPPPPQGLRPSPQLLPQVVKVLKLERVQEVRVLVCGIECSLLCV